jgi:hypothetical protein
MQYFSCRSVATAIALCTALALQAVAAPAACSSGIPNNTGTSEWTPTSDFTINGDGTVIHLKTGLMWKRCVEGTPLATCLSGGYSASLMSWAEALNAAVTSNFAGYADWRLPNKKELESIIDLCGVAYQTTNKVVFPAGFGDTWTSTTHPRDPTIAYSVNFDLGTTRVFNLKTAKLGVVLVRAGRTADSADLLKP